MNPLTNTRNLQKLCEKEIDLGVANSTSSWHYAYRDSAWIFIGGLSYDLTEGDIVCVFSQYGEIVNINLVRDKKTGKSKGFAFLCYEDQRSTILAVDNFNGIKLAGRVIRVDHVEKYKLPKEVEDEDEISKHLRLEGCGPETNTSENQPVHDSSTKSKSEPRNTTAKERLDKVRKERKDDEKEKRHGSKHYQDRKDSESKKPHRGEFRDSRSRSPVNRFQHHRTTNRFKSDRR